MIKKILNELVLFSKNPTPDINDSQISVNPVKLFFILFGINLIIGLFILSSISSFVCIAFHISFRPIDISWFYLMIANIFFVPVVEEIAFRLPLKFSKWNFSLSLFFISFFIGSYLLGTVLVNINHYLIQRLVISSFVFVLIFVLLSKKKVYNKMENAVANNYKLFFYVFLLLFVLRHTDNYQLNPVTIIFLPILLLPQFVGGFLMSYTRLKISFFSSILFHSLINLVIYLPQFWLAILE